MQQNNKLIARRFFLSLHERKIKGVPNMTTLTITSSGQVTLKKDVMQHLVIKLDDQTR